MRLELTLEARSTNIDFSVTHLREPHDASSEGEGYAARYHQGLTRYPLHRLESSYIYISDGGHWICVPL